MISTQFYFTLADTMHRLFANFEKTVLMPYKVEKGDKIQASDAEGEYEFEVQSAYFDLSTMQMTVSLGELDTVTSEEHYLIALADFKAWGWVDKAVPNPSTAPQGQK